MSEFDPYLKWLGIRDPMRPPHHYRLLGIDLYESDPDIIKGAARRQINHVRTFAASENGHHAKTIESRLKNAARVLLHEEARPKYDQQLQTLLARAGNPGGNAAPAVPVATPVVPSATPVPPPVVQTAPIVETGPAIHTGEQKKANTASMSPREQRLHRQREAHMADRKPNPLLWNLIGVIGGGIAAVVCASLIINSNWFQQMMNPGFDPVSQTDSDTGSSDSLPDFSSIDNDEQPLPSLPEDVPVDEEGADSGDDHSTDGFAGVDPGAPPILRNGEDGGTIDPPGDTTNDPGNASMTQPTARLAVPDEAKLIESRKLIQDLYPKIYDRSISQSEKSTQLRELIQSSGETTDPAPAFVLLAEAMEVSSRNGQPKICFDALQALEDRFEIDFFEMAESSLGEMSRKIDAPEQQVEFCEALTSLTVRGLREGQYKFAASMSTKAATAAKKVNPVTHRFAKQLKDDVNDIERLVDRAIKAETTLSGSADDPTAHETLGDRICLLDGEFASGIEHWFYCNDSAKKTIAQHEQNILEAGANQDRLKAAADAWYEAGQREDGFRQVRMLSLAVARYYELLPLQKGLAREVTNKRINEIEALVMDAPTNVAFSEPISKKQLLERVKGQPWAFRTANGDSFRVFFQGGNQIRIVRQGRSARKEFGSSGRLFVVPLEDNSTLYFSLRADGATMDYKKTDDASGNITEQGTGRR